MSKYFILILWAAALMLSLFGSDIDAIQASATAAIAIGAGASLLGGLVSDYMNTKSQADTNEANKEIARENRVWQSNQNQLSREWSERQWNLNNQYNTPSAIAQRQREAGFNPYLLGSQLGNGQSQPADADTYSVAPDTPSMVAPRVGATANALNNTSSQMANYALYKEGVDANAANQKAQSDALAVQTATELRKVMPTIKGQRSDEWFLKRHFQVSGDTSNNLNYNKAIADVERSQSEARISKVAAALEEEFGKKRTWQALAAADQQLTESAARIGKMASDAGVNDSKRKLLEKQAATEGQKYFTEMAKQFNLRKQGEYYIATAQQINLIKNLAREKMQMENDILRRRNSEDYSSYQGRTMVRSWLESEEGQQNVLDNFEIGQDIYLNQADKVIKTLSPVASRVNNVNPIIW